MRRRVVVFGFLGTPLVIGLILVAAAIWRKPLAEWAIATYLQRSYGTPVQIAIGEIDLSQSRIDHLKIGEKAPFEARDVHISYELSGRVGEISASEVSAHGRVEGGTVTLGDLEPFLAGGGKRGDGQAALPERIAVDHLHFGLTTPLGEVEINGKALLGHGALALDLTATDTGGHTTGAAKIDVSDAMAQPTMSGEMRLSLAPGSPLWGFAPQIAPQTGTIEARVTLDKVTAVDGSAQAGNPVQVALHLEQLQNPLMPAPLSGDVTASVATIQLPLAVSDITLALTGGLSPKAQATASGSGTLALVDGDLALDLALQVNAGDEKITLAGWQARQPKIALPLSLRFAQGELVVALPSGGEIAHQGLADLAKTTAIGAGKIKLLVQERAFSLRSADGGWNGQAALGALDFKIKAAGEAVQVQAPAVMASAVGGGAGVEWRVEAAKVAFQNPARGMSGKNAVIKLSGKTDAITGEIRISSFTAGAGLPTLTLNGDSQIKGNRMTAKLNAITGAGGGVNLGKIAVKGNLATGSYEADLDLGPIVFAVGGLQPEDLFPGAKAYIEDFSGTVRLEGPIIWSKGKARSELKLGLEKFSGTAGPVQFLNMNGVITIDEPWPLSTLPGQEIAIEQILAGLPMSNALVRFQLGAPVMHIAEGRLEMAGGRASIDPTDINMTAAGQHMVLKIDQLSVSELFQVAGVAGLSGDGTITGQAPITLFSNGIIIDHAKFAADAPGVLRYDTAQAPAALSSAGDSVGLALQALSDFHYKELIVTLDRKLTGDTDLALHVAGSNPSFYNGYPVEFNLTLSGKLDEVLRKGLAGYRLPSIIEQRLKELQ